MPKNIYSKGAQSKAVVALILLFLVGCVSDSRMPNVPESKADFSPKPMEAVVVFMRPSRVNQYITAVLYDITDRTPEFIGILAAWKKIAHPVTPGAHRFMVVSGGGVADFVDAEVSKGKSYFVRVTPSAWSPRFFLEPYDKTQVSTGGFSEDLNDCKWVENTPASRQWSVDNMPSVLSKMEHSLNAWLQKPDRPTLRPEDGR